MKKHFLFVLLSLFSFAAFSAIDPAELLLSTFSSQCPNVVTFSGSGTILLSNYKSALLELKNRDNCTGLSSSVASLANFEKAFTNYELYRSSKLEKENKERLVSKYTLYLAQNQLSLSADEIAFLEETIFTNQAQIIAINSDIIRFESMNQGIEQGSSAFIGSVNELLSILDGPNQCLNKTESLYGNLIGTGLSIASLYSGPASSLGLALAGSVSKSVSAYVRDVKYNNILSEVDSALWPNAFRCVSEAMSKSYCDSVQTQNLFNDYLADEVTNKSERTIFAGVDLLNYTIRGLDEWLIQVFAGSPITSQGDLSDRSKPKLQAELLGHIIDYMQAYKNIKNEEFQTINDPSLISNAVYSAFVGLSYIIKNPSSLTPATGEGQCYEGCSSHVQNPIFTARSQTLLLFQMFGLNEIPNDCRIDGQDAYCTTLKMYLDQKGIKLNLENWGQAYLNAQSIVSDTLKNVNNIRAKTVSFDPVGLFVLANRKFSNKSNAKEGLEAVIENGEDAYKYIEEVACRDEPEFCEDGQVTWQNSYSLSLEDINQTIDLTKSVLELVREASNPRSITDVELPAKCQISRDIDIFVSIDNERKEKAFILSSCITDLLELAERGNDIFFSKVRRMVAIELETRLIQGDMSTPVEDVLRATRDDLVERLTTSLTQSSNVSIGQILTGLDSNKDITVKTMRSFRDVFSKYIIKALNSDNSPRVKAELCFRTLPFLDSSKESHKFAADIYEMCSGQNINDGNGSRILKWNDYIKKEKRGLKVEYKFLKPKDDQICVLDNFFLENRLKRESRKTRKKLLDE